MLYNLVLVSAIHQYESAIHMFPPSWNSLVFDVIIFFKYQFLSYQFLSLSLVFFFFPFLVISLEDIKYITVSVSWGSVTRTTVWGALRTEIALPTALEAWSPGSGVGRATLPWKQRRRLCCSLWLSLLVAWLEAAQL